jgi:hypothetical protein
MSCWITLMPRLLLVVGDLDAVAGAAFAALQIVQHGAVAAAHVEHVRMIAHPMGDERQVGAQAG